MGRADNPLRRILNYASRTFLEGRLPVVYMLTVVGKNEAGALVPRGLFISPSQECFDKAAALSLKVNFTMLDKPLRKVVAFLDEDEFHSTVSFSLWIVAIATNLSLALCLSVSASLWFQTFLHRLSTPVPASIPRVT